MYGEAVISKHWQQNIQSWVAGTDSNVHGKIERGWVQDKLSEVFLIRMSQGIIS